MLVDHVVIISDFKMILAEASISNTCCVVSFELHKGLSQENSTCEGDDGY